MMQTEVREEDGGEIKTIVDAAQWLLLAYSLGHSDSCPCELCGEARKRVAAHRGKIVAA